jgi:DHA1 family tetracycline resistance protein-like MFS transporter
MKSNYPVKVVLVALFLDMVCQSLVFPAMPELLRSLSNGTAQSSALLFGYLVAAYAVAELLGAPFLGRLSDRIGRKPVLVVGFLGSSLSFAVAALAPQVALLFVGYGLAGLTSALIVVVNSVIADTVPENERATAFGWVGAVFGIGFVVGPIFGALVASWGLRAPFWAASVLSLCAFVLILTVFPESLPPDRRSRRQMQFVWPWQSIAVLGRWPLVRGLAWVFVLNALALQMLIGVWVPSATYRFGLGVAENGWLLAGYGLVMAVSQALIVPWIIPKLGNQRALLIGLAVSAISYLGYAIAPTLAVFIGVVLIGALGAIDEPAEQAIITNTVGHDEQGEVQGGLATIGSLMGIVGPVLGTTLFAIGSPGFPGLPYAMASALVFIGLVLACIALKTSQAES